MFKQLKNQLFPRQCVQHLRNTKAMRRFLDFPVSPLPDEAADVGNQVVIVQACQQYLSPVDQGTRNQAYLTHFRRKLDILKIRPKTRFPVEILAPAGIAASLRSSQ